jgi:hypothetical protein
MAMRDYIALIIYKYLFLLNILFLLPKTALDKRLACPGRFDTSSQVRCELDPNQRTMTSAD